MPRDSAKWAWQFDGTTSSTTLSAGTAVAAAVPTPLKVTHAADCASTAPTLSLQMDTVVLGRLTVGGFDVAATFRALGATPAAFSDEGNKFCDTYTGDCGGRCGSPSP